MKCALVLEGGSLRSMFSAGILDVLMEHNIHFDGVFGVSAGSLTGISYVSNQPGRTKRVNADFVNDRRYLGIRTYLRKKSVFNFDFLFGEISEIYLPLDRDTFMNSDVDFTCAATSCETGRPVYFSKRSCRDILLAARASSSMPLLSPIVTVDGIPCLDGGISVAVPYRRAMDEGYEKLVVVPTRHHGFRKPLNADAVCRMYAKKYARYPAFLKTLIDTPRMYGRQMEEIDSLEKKGELLTVRPQVPITISRTERDTVKLLLLYEEGRRVGKTRLPQIRQYLGEC